MEEINVIPTTVNVLTNTAPQVVATTPVSATTVESSPVADVLTSTAPQVVATTPVPVISIDSSVENPTSNPAILATDTTNLLGITNLSPIADTAAPSVSETSPVSVTPPVLTTLPTVLDVVKLDGVIGSKFQNLAEGNTIDLSDYTGIALKADITTKGEAAYTNNIGFYLVEDSIGTIKLADGTSLKPGDANYAVEAIKNALTNSLQLGKIDSKLGQDIAGGRIYAPVVIAQGSLTDFVSKNPTNGGGANDIHAYFNYIGANSDGVDHFKLLANNTFGVEDMYGGGDLDFNDLVVNMNIKIV